MWDCGQLRFLDEDQRRLMRHVDLALHQQAQTERRRSDAYVDGKVIWHNGADRRPGAAHIPGENVQFIKPYVAAVRLGL